VRTALRTVKGKAFDDRAGCAVAAALAGGQYAVDLYLSFSAQEEVGHARRPGGRLPHRARPGLRLEGTVCDDLPRKEDVSPTTELGKGPAITIIGSLLHCRQAPGPSPDRCGRGQRYPLPVQAARHRRHRRRGHSPLRSGVPSVTVAVPCRYIHNPVSILSLNDFDNTVALMKAALRRIE